MNEYENKIELMKYLNIFWKRKWFILIATILFIAAAAVISFLSPPKWNIDTIIVPSRIRYRTEEGIFQEIPFIPLNWIIVQTNNGRYNSRIATELSLDLKDFPTLKAENLDVIAVRISIVEEDVEKAKLILHSLLNHLKRESDNEADREKKRFDSQIKPREKEKEISERKIKTYKNKLNIIKLRKQEIEKEMSDIRGKKEELEKEFRLILKKKNRSEFESFVMLHYSNEIQQSSMNYNILNELLGNKKMEEKIINLEIEDKERLITQTESELIDLNDRKGKIYYAEITKEPTPSTSPVSPKKFLNVLIAALLGLMISTILTFFFEYLEKQKVKNKG